VNTEQEFDTVIHDCRAVFEAKMTDYGSSWRVLRPSSLTDQIYIKAQRIRSISEKGTRKVEEGIRPEFIGIINYSIIALIQLDLGNEKHLDLQLSEAMALYDRFAGNAKSLMMNKNHDYGEAWRNMRITSFNDLILMKLLRVKQIEDNEGKTFVSEGVDANYLDIINYSVFAMIKMMEEDNLGLN
jgi:hypothetical protein